MFGVDRMQGNLTGTNSSIKSMEIEQGIQDSEFTNEGDGENSWIYAWWCENSKIHDRLLPGQVVIMKHSDWLQSEFPLSAESP